MYLFNKTDIPLYLLEEEAHLNVSSSKHLVSAPHKVLNTQGLTDSGPLSHIQLFVDFSGVLQIICGKFIHEQTFLYSTS